MLLPIMEFCFLDILIAFFAIVIILLVAVHVYLLYIHHKYAHLPSPKGAGFYSGHIPLLTDAIKGGAYTLDLFKSWSDECGPVYVVWFYHISLVVVAHPDVMKELGSLKHPKPLIKPLLKLWNRQRFLGNSLVTIQHHHDWKDRRRTYDHSFTKHFLDSLIPQFNQVIHKHLVKHLKEVTSKGELVDMKSLFSNVTLEVISWVAFGMDFKEDDYVSQLCGSQGLSELINLGMEGGNLHINNPLLPYIKPFGGYQYTEAVAKLREIGCYCIQKRIKLIENKEECPQDILTQIITLSQNDDIGLGLEDLVDDFLTFYIAGQETTSNTLSFALIELLQSPDLLQRVEVEIAEAVDDSANIEKKHLDKLELVQSVIEETLRLHPTATFFGKSAGEDILTNDYRIPKGTEILASSYISHRNPEHFDNPLQFDPSRFEPGQKRPSPYIYFPFGIGHRSCIGRTFAMMEAKIILALLLKNFRLTLNEGFVLKKFHAFTSKPAGDVLCSVAVRKK